MKRWLGVLQDLALSLPLRLMWWVTGWLPVRAASALGAGIGVTFGTLVGSLHRKHRRVLRNLRGVFGSASDAEIARMARRSWRNTVAVFTEMPHVEQIARTRVELDIAPEVQELIDDGKPVLFLTAHLANWETLHFVVVNLGFRVTSIYTPQRNPFIARKVQAMRANPGCEFVPKQDAISGLFRAVKKGRSIAALADVRVDSGELVPFFGRETGTTLTPARIALRAGLPIVAARAVRLPHARFRFCAEAPLRPAEGLEEKAAALDVMQQFHARLEGWILEHPTDWLCTKRRWAKRWRKPAE